MPDPSKPAAPAPVVSPRPTLDPVHHRITWRTFGNVHLAAVGRFLARVMYDEESDTFRWRVDLDDDRGEPHSAENLSEAKIKAEQEATRKELLAFGDTGA